jgi:hypothetical protein
MGWIKKVQMIDALNISFNPTIHDWETPYATSRLVRFAPHQARVFSGMALNKQAQKSRSPR